MEGAEGQDSLLTSHVASSAEEGCGQIYQHLQWEEERGISVEVVKAHAVIQVAELEVSVPPVLHCEPFVMEEGVEEHPVDYQSYSRCFEG